MRLRIYPYKEIAINSAFLEIPAEYQRRLQMSKVKQMVAEFNGIIVNPPKVSYRDGRYIVIDGQHTIVGLKTLNGGKDLFIVCRVYTGLTKEEEALVFAEQTGASTPLSAGAKLRAKLVGQDAESHAFLAATEAAGLQLGTDHVRASHKIICVSTALKEFQQYGPDIYTEGLRAIVDAWQTWPAASSGRNRRAVSGAALRFLQAGAAPRRKNRLSARGVATLTLCALVSSRA